MDQIKVRVPATTANLGPCFDIAGIALNLYCDITIDVNKKSEIKVIGEGLGSIPEDGTNLVYKVIQDFCTFHNIKVKEFSLIIKNNIPINSGLGSSSAAIVGGLYAANAIFNDSKCNKDELLKFALRYEKHIDNLTPCFFGGFVLSAVLDDKVFYNKFDDFKKYFNDKSFIVIVPELRIETEHSRNDLLNNEHKFSHNDYVKGLNRSIANVISFIKGNFDSLKDTMNDTVWHQVQRKKSNPYMVDIIEQANDLGAYGTYLSGSGPAIISICEENKLEKVLNSMKKVLEKNNKKYIYYILKSEYNGVRKSE